MDMWNLRLFGVLVCVLLLAWVASGQQDVGPRLKPGDTIAVVVHGYDGYSGDFTLFADGSINGRGIGRLIVAGMTVEEVRKAVLKKLEETLREPIVTAFLRRQRADVVYLIGPGQGSGVIDLTPQMDVRQLVARISVPSEPDMVDVIIYRQGETPIKVDLWAVLQDKPGAWNGLLQPEDIIAFLPKPFIRVWFIGPFGSTGEVKVRQGWDVYETLASIGGVDPAPMTLDEAQLLVRRGPEMLRVPAKKHPEQRGLVLEPGDVVMLDQPKMIRVIVTGFAGASGEFIVREDLPLSQLMLKAQGAGPQGTLQGVLLFRGGEILRVDATGPLTGQPPSQFRLQDGDFFYVPKNERFLYAFGEVNTPGKYVFQDGERIFAADLLAQAGGTSDRGSLRRVLLLRPDETGRYQPTRFNLDEFIKDGNVKANPELRPGDLVFFGEPRGLTLQTIAQLIGGMFLFDSIVRR